MAEAEGVSKNALKKQLKAEEAAKKKALKESEKAEKKLTEVVKAKPVGDEGEELDPTQYYENRIKAVNSLEVAIN